MYTQKIIKIVILFFLSTSIHALNNDLVKIRDMYYKAHANKADSEKFPKVIQSSTGVSKSLIEGYTGMSFMIKANFSYNPYYQLSYFTKGKGMLDSAIDGDLKNVELRFLRFCVQTNAPGFLGYSGKITEDKKVILMYYKSLDDDDLKSRIKSFMNSSKHCTKEEKLIF
jgi:hypothetical protein